MKCSLSYLFESGRCNTTLANDKKSLFMVHYREPQSLFRTIFLITYNGHQNIISHKMLKFSTQID